MKLKQLLLPLIPALLMGAPVAQAADEPFAREVMVKVDARDDGDRMTSNMEMLLIDKKGKQRVRELRRFVRDVGADTHSLLFFLRPSDVKDTGFLTYDYDDASRDDDQWLYLPALRKSKRIASSDKSGSFMGSDFSYSDMTARDLDEYDFKLLKEVKVAGHKVWLIQSTPRSEATIKETGYTKSVTFVRQDNYVVVRAIHWQKEGNKLKYQDIKKLELIDGIWFATETHMTTKKGKQTLHKTILKFTDVAFNQPMDESLFTVRSLEKGL
jgi:hypothetical protein